VSSLDGIEVINIEGKGKNLSRLARREG